MMRWDARHRWWLLPGEVVGTITEGGRSRPVVFEYDDGTLWSLRIGTERAQVIWDHTALGFALSPNGASTASIHDLREVLHALATPRPGWALTDVEQKTIDHVALGLYDSRMITGRKLRHFLGMTTDRFAPVKASLSPRYMLEEHGDKGDYYGLTLPGIFRSKQKDRARKVIEAALLVMRTKFESNPDMMGFSTDDVIQRGDLDASDGGFIDAVLHAAWLTLGGGGHGEGRSLQMNYGVPEDVEDLVRCASLDEFMRLVRESGHDHRAWPTAPMRIGNSEVSTAPSPATAAIAEGEMKYDVTLSFAGEDRAHAEALAERLRAVGVKVFYDLYEAASLWGKDLYEHLHSIYSEQASHCVIFVSEHYAKKLWTTHERKAAQERALRERGGEYILPIRIDETRLPGLSETIGYVSISEGIDRIAEMLLVKLGKRNSVGRTSTPSVTSSAPEKPASNEWLPPVAKLRSRSGGSVPPLSWRLGLRRPTAFAGTKAEAHDALMASVVTYDLRNMGRSARFPRLLAMSGVPQQTLANGTRIWTHAYETGAANEVGDEQLALTGGAELYFQRDVLWDADVALDFGRLSEDALMFVVFAGRYAKATGITGAITLSVDVRTPPSESGALAIFHATPVEPDQPSRAGRMRRTEIGGTAELPLASQEYPHEILGCTKRLLDRVANEFELAPSVFAGNGPNFLAVSSASLEQLHGRLDMTLKDYAGAMKALKGRPL